MDHADRFERVVCADGRADAPPGFRDMWDGRIATIETDGLAGIVEGTLASWFTEDWRLANPEALAEVRAMVLGNDPVGYVNCCLALKELDYLKRLGDVTMPVLFVGGSEDKGAAPEVLQAMADATPGGDHRRIEGAAHVANINAPEGFNAAIGAFLGL